MDQILITLQQFRTTMLAAGIVKYAVIFDRHTGTVRVHRSH